HYRGINELEKVGLSGRLRFRRLDCKPNTKLLILLYLSSTWSLKLFTSVEKFRTVDRAALKQRKLK
ncbi:hypothetical protein, partial [Acinetobacter baumannii]|uniref:hypothetical protein n=1 Tax=Acinetobacter baumannii TaxID=470 RepID=UPI003F1ADEF8